MDALGDLYPRTPVDRKRTRIPQQLTTLLESALEPFEASWDISLEISRLIDCVDMNALGVYQHNELLGHTSRYASLNSVAVYPQIGSLFNHRWDMIS